MVAPAGVVRLMSYPVPVGQPASLAITLQSVVLTPGSVAPDTKGTLCVYVAARCGANVNVHPRRCSRHSARRWADL